MKKVSKHATQWKLVFTDISGTYEKINSLIFSTCLSDSCLPLKYCSLEEHAVEYRIYWETQTPFAGDEDILLYK